MSAPGDDAARAAAFERFARTRSSRGSWPAQTLVEAAAMDEVVRVWRSLDQVAEDPAVLLLRVQARERLARRAAMSRWRRMAGGGLVAAALVGAISLATTDRLPHLSSPMSVAPALADRLFVNGHAAPRAFQLADGSRLTLDSQSAVRLVGWREGAGERRAFLDRGRAFIEVAHDPRRPFRFVLGDATVTATGTRFAVQTFPPGVGITLVEGKVNVDAPVAGQTRTIARMVAGTRLMLIGGQWQVQPVDTARETEWRTGLLTFDDRPLREVVAELNRYLPQPLAPVSPAAARMRISGVFRLDDPHALSEAINAFAGKQVVQPVISNG